MVPPRSRRFFLSADPAPDWLFRPLALLVPLNLSSPSSASICATSNLIRYAAQGRPLKRYRENPPHLLPSRAHHSMAS